jgi:hypothetical protein
MLEPMSRPRFRKFVAALVTIFAVAASLLVTTGTASAASKCITNSDTFSTPGRDTNVDVILCVVVESRQVWADAWVEFDGPMLPEFADRFEVFEFNLRLEYDDVVEASWPCRAVDYINDHPEGTYYCFETAHLTKNGGPYWTADATVRYNINNDGRGDQLWPLAGTPRI